MEPHKVMKYWSNGDGTFTVTAWEVTFTDGSPLKLVYTQEIALREWSAPAGDTMVMRLLVRDHRPGGGVEIPRPTTTAQVPPGA